MPKGVKSNLVTGSLGNIKTMKLNITHTTKYTYDAPVSYGLQQVRLTPVSTTHQTVTDWTVEIEGGIQELSFED